MQTDLSADYGLYNCHQPPKCNTLRCVQNAARLEKPRPVANTKGPTGTSAQVNTFPKKEWQVPSVCPLAALICTIGRYLLLVVTSGRCRVDIHCLVGNNTITEVGYTYFSLTTLQFLLRQRARSARQFVIFAAACAHRGLVGCLIAPEAAGVAGKQTRPFVYQATLTEVACKASAKISWKRTGHVSGSRGGFQRELLHVRRRILQLIRPKTFCVQHPDIHPTEVCSSRGLFARWELPLPSNISLNMSRASAKRTKTFSAGITPVMVYRHCGPVLCFSDFGII